MVHGSESHCLINISKWLVIFPMVVIVPLNSVYVDDDSTH